MKKRRKIDEVVNVDAEGGSYVFRATPRAMRVSRGDDLSEGAELRRLKPIVGAEDELAEVEPGAPWVDLHRYIRGAWTILEQGKLSSGDRVHGDDFHGGANDFEVGVRIIDDAHGVLESLRRGDGPRAVAGMFGLIEDVLSLRDLPLTRAGGASLTRSTNGGRKTGNERREAATSLHEDIRDAAQDLLRQGSSSRDLARILAERFNISSRWAREILSRSDVAKKVTTAPQKKRK